MRMEREVIEYVPSYLRQFREIQEIFYSLQIEYENLYEKTEEVLDDLYIETASKEGVERFETNYQILKNNAISLQGRKFALLAKFVEQLPVTKSTLKKKMDSLCGEEGYTVSLDMGHLIFTVRVALTSKENYKTVKDMLEELLPCNLRLDCDLMYNRNEMLSIFTYGELEEKTHKIMRSEVL